MKPSILNYLVLAISLVFSSQTYALEILEDLSLGETTGEGIAFLPENIKIVFDDTAYIRTLPSTTTPAFGQKAELLWYGVALTGADGNVSDRVGNAITSWGTADNPWVLKAETLSRVKYGGGAATGIPMLSLYAPEYALNDGGLKYAFWSDLVVRDKTTNNILSRMQAQSVWNDVTLNGSRFSIFQSTVDYDDSTHQDTAAHPAVATNNGSFGIAWLNRINSAPTGVFRFSVAETAQPDCILTPTACSNSTTDSISTAAPTFNSVEGMYATDFDMNVVVGNLHYQPLIMGSVGVGVGIGPENFQIELVRIPNNPDVYNKFYRDYDDVSQEYKMCTGAKVDCSQATHSELSIGKVEFKNPAGVTVDLGSAKYEGLMIQHLKIRTLGL